MLAQIITVDRSKRPASELEILQAQLSARGHVVKVHESAAHPSYRGASRQSAAVVGAIWESHRRCLAYARERGASATLVLEDDCEFDDLSGVEVAERFLAGRLEDVDLFFLGASPNCWWSRTADPDVIRFSHVYWWHAIIFTGRFMRRCSDLSRTWSGANDLHFSRLVRRGELAAFGLRRQVAFQKDRRNRLAETLLYGLPWGDGRRLIGAAAAGAALWWGIG